MTFSANEPGGKRAPDPAAPTFFYEGQVLDLRVGCTPTRRSGTAWVPVIVAVAAGTMARVVNEVRGIDQWTDLTMCRTR